MDDRTSKGLRDNRAIPTPRIKMLQFPSALIPTHIEVASLPRYPRASLATKSSFWSASLLLSDICLGGELDLIFRNYPANSVDIDGKVTALNNQSGRLIMAGYNDAWDFWHQTKSGHLTFEISPFHGLWNRLEDLQQWQDKPLDGRPCVWRCTEMPRTFGDNAIQSIVNFKMRIVQELRSN